MIEVRARACGKCERCGKGGREVHHRIRVYDDPSLALDPDNGELLCIKCHKKEHR
jgi:5-methylcytosine-specific restriction endonuclease McrA